MKCRTRWNDPLQPKDCRMTISQLNEVVIERFQLFANNLRKLLMAEPCPKCGVMINKTGGCVHIMCTKCKHEFCWLCLGDYYGYAHKPGMQKYCVLAGFATFSLLLLITVIFILKLLSLFWDSWSSSSIFKLFTLRNVVFYSGATVIANISFFIGLITARNDLRLLWLYFGIPITFLPWSEMVYTCVQVVIFELTALPAFIFMILISVGTFIFGIGTLVCFQIPRFFISTGLRYASILPI